MSRGDSRHQRTDEERERDRLERERRRALRRGESPPPLPPPRAPDPPPVPAEALPQIVEPSPPAIEPPIDSVGADDLFAPPAQPEHREPHAPDPADDPREPAPPPGEPAAAEPAELARASEREPGPQPQPRVSAARRGIPPVPSIPQSPRRGLRARRSALKPEEAADEATRPSGRLGRRAAAGQSSIAASRGSRAPRTRRGRFGALVALVLVLGALWFLFSLFQPLKGGGSGTVIVEIPRGTGAGAVADLLAKDGVVSSSFFFNLRATIGGDRGSLKSGRFQLKRDMSYGSALTALTTQRPTAATTRVTIPEGISRGEEAARVKRDGIKGAYLKASVRSHVLAPRSYGAPAGTPSLEGFLFPATYELLPGASVSQLVNAQLAAFKQKFSLVDLKAARRRHLKPYDVLIVASMVEREAQRDKERPLIAAVIYNRLRAHTPLGIDATIRYAIGNYTRPLTNADLRISSRYNTRRRRGLPPTPIGSPGLASIQAAAHPASVGYLYYVVKPGACGEHAFSSTYAQFLKDAARYASARAAKGGRSPTKC